MTATALASFSGHVNALGEHAVDLSYYPRSLYAPPWPLGPYFMRADEVSPLAMAAPHRLLFRRADVSLPSRSDLGRSV